MLKQIPTANVSNVMIMGDFNYKQIDWENETVEGREDSDEVKFLETMQDLFLYQHVRHPTRFRNGQEPSRLDLVFTSEEAMVEEVHIGDPLGKSDHAVLHWDLFLSTECGRPGGGDKQKKLNFFKTDFEGMVASLHSADWSFLDLEDLGVEGTWREFKQVLTSCISTHVPAHRNKTRVTATPWWNKDLTKEVKRKFEFWKQFCETNSAEDFRLYATQRNKTLSKIREHRRKYETRSLKTSSKNQNECTSTYDLNKG